MMASSHASSGLASWLVACSAAVEVGVRPSLLEVTVGAVVAAGCAVAPDMDCPEATIARVFGPLSQWVSRWVAHCCAYVHARTRTRLDPPRRGGHRTLTHTAVAALAAGPLATLVCLVGGRLAAMVVVFAAVGLAARSLFTPRQRGDLGATGCALAASALIGYGTPAGQGWWWLGLPVAFGWLAHLFGDALTDAGCPILWPLMVRGRRWYQVGTPRAVRFRAGCAWEKRLALPVATVTSLAAAGWLLAMV